MSRTSGGLETWHAKMFLEDELEGLLVIKGQGVTQTGAMESAFQALHRQMFGQAISQREADNFHQYSTWQGFRVCCQRGFEDEDFRPTAELIWTTLQEAEASLVVSQRLEEVQEVHAGPDRGSPCTKKQKKTSL